MSTRAIVPNGDGEGSLGVKGLAFGAMYTKTAEAGASDERVATTKFVMTAIKNAMLAAFPVGTVISTSNSANPSTYLGGTWEQFAQGRTLVGAGTGTDSNKLAMTFNAGDTGGEYKHQLSVGEMPAHRHGVYTDVSFPANQTSIQNEWKQVLANAKRIDTVNNGYYVAQTGGNQSHNNISPYIVVYYFKRVS